MTSLGRWTKTLFVSAFQRASQRLLVFVWQRAANAPNIAPRGIPVRLWAIPRRDRASIIETVRNALRLIAAFDPHRYTRIQRDLASVVISPIVPPGTAGVYLDTHRVCGINPDSSHFSNFVLVAALIVHEATHARLRRFRHVDRCAARIESICRAQELAFLVRVPHSEPFRKILHDLEQQRARDFEQPSSVKADRAFLALHREAPGWMATLTERVTRWLLDLRPNDR
jgi:hypothetical protein